MLIARLETAIAWLQDHPDVYCVVSGGTGEDEVISEAECMYRYMTAHGIAPERIIREDRSGSTRENISFSLQKLQEAGLLPASGSMEGAQIAVVTNEFHSSGGLCSRPITMVAFSHLLCAGAVRPALPDLSVIHQGRL